jgi:hypothetical protein
MAEMKKFKKKLSIFIIQKVLHLISTVKISQTLIAKTLKKKKKKKKQYDPQKLKLFCYHVQNTIAQIDERHHRVFHEHVRYSMLLRMCISLTKAISKVLSILKE